MEVIKDIAAVVGCVLSCFSLLTVIVKPFRKKIVNFIAEVADKPETVKAINELRQEMNVIKLQIEENAEENRRHHGELHVKIDAIATAEKKSNVALKDIIRESIVDTYYTNLQNKKLHYEEWETVSELADSYFALDGNHFVKGLMDQMKKWEIVQ